jgi:hypothetical protein
LIKTEFALHVLGCTHKGFQKFDKGISINFHRAENYTAWRYDGVCR